METCAKLGCDKPKAKLQKYCSRDHAPFGHLSDVNQKGSQSVASMEKSIFLAHGEVSEPSLNKEFFTRDDILNGSSTQHLRNTRPPSSEPIIRKTESDLQQQNDSNGETCPRISERNDRLSESPEERKTLTEMQKQEIGMLETKLNIVEKKLSEGKSETPFMGSLVQLNNLDEAKLTSMTLIDDSARHLFELMNTITTENKGIGHINAACNCARNLTNLLRLKLDLIKTIRRV